MEEEILKKIFKKEDNPNPNPNTFKKVYVRLDHETEIYL